MSDQNLSEELDDDKLGGEFPPEEPLAVDDYGTTPAEEAWDEPLEERIAREEPDVLAPPDEGLELVQPDEGAHTDTEPDEVASLVDHQDDTLDDVAQEHEGAVPAEEAALHITEDES
jgi:hypothetical protein